MHSVTHRLAADTSQADLLAVVETLNRDPAIHGILVQLPLPASLDEKAVINAIDPAKDVDGLHPMNAGYLAQGLPALVPCTPTGCMVLLDRTLGSLSGKRAVVVGRSVLVGKPVAQLLLAADCTVTIAHTSAATEQGRAHTCPQEHVLSFSKVNAQQAVRKIIHTHLMEGNVPVHGACSRYKAVHYGRPLRLLWPILYGAPQAHTARW